MFIGSAYATFPIVLLGIPVAIASNALTLSEGAIYHFFDWVAIGWCGLLFFWCYQTVHNYTVGEAVKTILLTLITMILLWVVIFITVGLFTELGSFIYSVYQEVSM
jgi:hypothetical protein